MSIFEVRNTKRSVICYPKRYYDNDINKYLLDKCEGIKAYSLHNIIDDIAHNEIGSNYYPTKKAYNKWFIPLDNDWND